jgi:hypothetical protein
MNGDCTPISVGEMSPLNAHREGYGRGSSWWAHQDSNLGPAEYECIESVVTSYFVTAAASKL